MKEILKYAFFWRYEANEGILQLQLADGMGATVVIDSPQEGLLLLDVLRNEKPVYYEPVQNMIMTGMEPVGEGEVSS